MTASVPVRYPHSVNGICSYFDFEATVTLMTEVVKSLNRDIINRF